MTGWRPDHPQYLRQHGAVAPFNNEFIMPPVCPKVNFYASQLSRLHPADREPPTDPPARARFSGRRGRCLSRVRTRHRKPAQAGLDRYKEVVKDVPPRPQTGAKSPGLHAAVAARNPPRRADNTRASALPQSAARPPWRPSTAIARPLYARRPQQTPGMPGDAFPSRPADTTWQRNVLAKGRGMGYAFG